MRHIFLPALGDMFGGMRFPGILLAAIAACATECIPIDKAQEKVGAVSCVKAQVLSVSASESGTHFLNFCADSGKCPFTVVVFARDLRQVGDVRQLAGRPVEIHGKIRLYDGVPEMILSDSRQLHGVSLPPVPRDYPVVARSSGSSQAGAPKIPGKYDVEKHGKHRAGTFKSPKYKARKHRPKPRKGAETVPEEE